MKRRNFTVKSIVFKDMYDFIITEFSRNLFAGQGLYMKYSVNPGSISSFVVGRPRPE